MLKIIKQAAVDAVEQSSPVIMAYGEVVSTSPVRFILEQRLPIERRHIVNTRTFDRAVFETGERVVFLRVQGGQKYLYVDKLV